jgi:hypothetical protein
MTKITQEQLIDQIKSLKEIKPRQEWAILLKSQILAEKQIQPAVQPARFTGFANIFSFAFAPRKLAYSFAVILFLVIGVFGFARYTVPGDLLFPVKKITEQSQAALAGQTGVKQDVANLNNRINDLAQVAKAGRTNSIPSAISEINSNVSQLVKSLKNSPAQDSQTIKDIENSLKTLADVPGTDLTSSQDIKDLYQTVVQSQIADLQKTTLTDEQKTVLTEAEDLYNQGKYTEALEDILLISK